MYIFVHAVYVVFTNKTDTYIYILVLLFSFSSVCLQ